MSDLFGHAEPAKPFRDIRNQQSVAAEEKAVLCLQLKEMVSKVPPNVASGSIQQTRAWVAAQQRAMKVLRNSRSSRADLSTALQNMRSYVVQ